MNIIKKIKNIFMITFSLFLLFGCYINARSDIVSNFYNSIDMSQYNSTVNLSNASEFVKALGVLDQNENILNNIIDEIVNNKEYDNLQSYLGLNDDGSLKNDASSNKNIYLIASIVDTVGYVTKEYDNDNTSITEQNEEYYIKLMTDDVSRPREAAKSSQSSANADNKRW